MTLHLIKLSVGPKSLSELEAWQAQRLKEMERNHQKPELMHIMRHKPKREEELLAGGSIYWVINGWVCARQRLLEFRPVLRDNILHCGLVYDKELVRVQLHPRRPFQGWRYLAPQDAPADMIKTTDDYDMPEDMRRELTALGLL